MKEGKQDPKNIRKQQEKTNAMRKTNKKQSNRHMQAGEEEKESKRWTQRHRRQVSGRQREARKDRRQAGRDTRDTQEGEETQKMKKKRSWVSESRTYPFSSQCTTACLMCATRKGGQVAKALPAGAARDSATPPPAPLPRGEEVMWHLSGVLMKQSRSIRS